MRTAAGGSCAACRVVTVTEVGGPGAILGVSSLRESAPDRPGRARRDIIARVLLAAAKLSWVYRCCDPKKTCICIPRAICALLVSSRTSFYCILYMVCYTLSAYFSSARSDSHHVLMARLSLLSPGGAPTTSASPSCFALARMLVGRR